MKYRYYITDLGMGQITGTDSEEVARSYAGSEDYFVVDSETGMWITTDGDEPVEPAIR